MLELGLIFSGVIISTISMAIGIGGGILWTPLLILAYGLSPQEAIATSLFIQITGLGSGTFAYFKAKLIHVRLSVILSVIALPGVIVGSYLTVNLPEHTIQMILGIMAMLLAILFVVSNEETETLKNVSLNAAAIRKVAPIPGFFGFLMGFLSVGISEWLIPALRHKLKLDMPHAIGTSMGMMFILAIISSALHFNLSGNFHGNIFILASIGTIIGAQIGARISQRINDQLLKQSFIYLMTLIGIHLIFQAI
ncbi:MAG: sulfite exporter TauE/SafE family protein [Gammaproteobacteria bacterium]|nr:sulfite exporter TauE/SafE family protein [Gammaproteobacteria bacterium]